MELEELSFQFLREITDGFSEERKLNEGAFGVVYKGVTKTGEDVAVKKLKSIGATLNFKQFQNEFNNLKKLKHQNIVQVLGYCYESEKRYFNMADGNKVFLEYGEQTALCLEYLHNGSLQNHLYDEFCGLDWHTRFKIIEGTCQGLKYMHEELEEPIYHLDLKPDNILLDKDMVPKVADFGLSKILGKEQTWTTNSPYGTLGYQPPEYIDKGEISGKFDIFSLGVIIIMIVAGPQGYFKCGNMSSEEFIFQVQKNWRNRLQATCSSDSLLEAYCHQVETCTEIALKCVEKDSQRRPDIVMITEKLNEIEIDIIKVHKKGCQGTISEISMHNNKIEMRKESKDITCQLKNNNFMSGPSCSELEFVEAQETSLDVVEELLIVGRIEEKGAITTSLVDSMSAKIVILPIHGIGGIGKTTFARLIYNDPNFKCYSQVWVNVSQRFDLNNIRASIISQLSEKESQTNERQTTHNCLTKLLSGKKIMIVLDDLWEDNQFQLQELKDMLYHNESNIIILVTTRSERVAERICTNLEPYKILPLTNDMCWDIIKQRSCFEAREDKEQLMGIGREIAQKCGGVALAAQSLGFTLRSMNFDQWMEVKDNDIWNEPISKDVSMPNHVLASLMLSYSYMTPCLKPCFTYCAIFPKGHKIVKNDLIYQWISLGFIKPSKLLSNMQLCEKYIVQLIGHSFFHVLPKTSEAYHEDATLFTMHDLVHDLALSLLGDQILYQSKQGSTWESSCCYALLADCSKPLGSSTTSPDWLKAMRFLECGKIELCGSTFSPARYLCVLDLGECCIQNLPDSIGQLEELRYLNAPGIRDQWIPNSITNLSKLIYLNIQGSSEILALPEEIGKMEVLTYIDLSGCTKIQNLPESFCNLTNLDHLDLSNCSQVTGVSQLLGSLTKIQHLNLSYCKNIGKLPGALGTLTELQYLNLSYSSYLDIEDAEVLGSLTKLKYLNLSSEECYLKRLPEALGGFSELKYLNLSGCVHLKVLPKSFDKLCNLVHLDLARCYLVEVAPIALQDLTRLRYLNLSFCSQTLRGLEEVIGSLTELHYLNLQGCLRTIFGDQQGEEINSFLGLISTLYNMEHLILSSNDYLYNVPETLGNLRKLHTLDLSWCSNLQRLPTSISQICSLKFLNTMHCDKLDKSSIPQFNSTSILFPQFIVCAIDGESNSTLIQLEKEDPTVLEISRLENVKLVEEAQRIKLINKKMMGDLTFVWTRDAKRYVDDIEVLKELVPPGSLGTFRLQGYMSVNFPSWMMGIANYLPYLTTCYMWELPKCHKLPPLGQLPNLQYLHIKGLDSIRKIDRDFYGGTGPFPRLRGFFIGNMKSLEEWNTQYTSGEDGEEVLVFHNLTDLDIINCPLLRLKPCPPRGEYEWSIVHSDGIISSWEERGKVEDSTSCALDTPVTVLSITGCKVPMHQWRLLYHLPTLTELTIEKCSDLTCISPGILGCLTSLQCLTLIDCGSLAGLPDRLGDLTSLQKLCIYKCGSIKVLPDSIEQLTNLQCLLISDCPDLKQWCESTENKMKLAHIKKIRISLAGESNQVEGT